MNAANQRRLTPVLVILAVLLGALLLLLLSGVGRGVRWGAPRAAPPVPSAGAAVALPQPLPLTHFQVVWEKPLFSPDRKPVTRAVAGGSSLGDLDLTGIILTPGLHMALLHDKNGDKQVRLREGESLPDGSITLVEIHARSALFDSSTGRTELKLPAGAPIDKLKQGAAKADELRPADGGSPDADPGNGQPAITLKQPIPQNQVPAAFIDRLKKNIQKRRAAQAAAANEGVR